MKKIENEYTSSIFENIKHIDEYENEFYGMLGNFQKF